MKRMYYIDWLRILAILIVFTFHTSHFFDPLYWHVKNPQKSEIALLFLGFVNIWIMPMFFFLSGATGLFGLQKDYGSFFLSKFKRLFIPFTMGVLLLIPPQKYLEGLSNHTFIGSYWEFLLHYFTGGIFHYHIGFNCVWIGAISYHLWFLGHLLIISLVLFPLMKYLQNNGASILHSLFRLTNFKGGALLMFIPIAVIRILLKKQYPDYTGWSDLAMYAGYFLFGFFYVSHEGLKQSLVKSKNYALFLGVILFILYIASFPLKTSFLGQLFQDNRLYWFYMFQETAGALTTWCWIIVFVALGLKYLDKDTPFRNPLNEAVLPFYILHQTVLLLVGYVVVQWNWPIIWKFGFIAVSSFCLIATIYLLAIRPYSIMRFLFGMNPKK